MLETKLPIFGTLFFILGLLFLIYLLIRILRFISRKKKSKRWVYAQSSFLNASLFVLGLVLLMFSWLFFWTGKSLRAFHTFHSQTQVGEIEVIPETESASRLVLSLFGSTGKIYTQSLFIPGNKLQLEAELLNFKPWVKDLGIYPCYKIVRINVYDVSDPDSTEIEAFPLISEGFIQFELSEGGTELFLWTKKFDKLLPWVEAKVLKSTDFSVAEQEAKRIFITEDEINLSEISPTLSSF